MTQHFLSNESDTYFLGKRLAKNLAGNEIIFLHGDLGTGKTTFARGVLQGLGYSGLVKSPTYTLVENYEIAGHTVIHCDLYRLKTPAEWTMLGLDDYLGRAIFLIEWPEQAQSMLPTPDLQCYLTIKTKNRLIEFLGVSTAGKQLALC